MSTHPNDVVVLVSQYTQPAATDYLRVLILSTAGAKDYKVYDDIDDVVVDYAATTEAYKMAAALLGQSPALPCVAIAGIAAPTNAAGLVTALNTLRASHDDWYVLLTDKTDDDYIEAVAAWADATEPTEAQLLAGAKDARKLYVAESASKDISVASKRTVLVYGEDGQVTAAAWIGLAGSYYPAGVTYKFKQPSGVSAPVLTATELNTLMDANVNIYTTEGKQTYIKHGVMADGEWIDAVLAADYIALRMTDELHRVLVSSPRIEYSDAGITLIGGAVLAALDAATALGLISRNPDTGKGKYNVILPKRADATQAQIDARRIPDIVWEAERVSAIHGTTVRGVLKTSLT